MIYLLILSVIAVGVTGYLFGIGYIKVAPDVVPEPSPIPPKQAPEPVTEPKPVIPPPMPEKSNRERLYDTAKASIGKDMSPLDKAPDKLGCMESLDGVYLAAFGKHLLKPEDRLSTARGYQAMLTNPELEQIWRGKEQFGDIAIAPSGTSTKGVDHGHCWVWGKETAMSNDSDSGLWKANYLLANVFLLFETQLGFKVRFFRPK